MARYPPGPKLTVDAFWVDRGRLLLVRRGRPPFRGRWALPGGFVDAGETTEAAVVRELLEETGLRARPRGLVGVYSDPRRDPRGPTVSATYRMVGRGREPQAGDDAGEARWFSVARLPPLAFDHDRIVADGLSLGRARRRAGRSPRRR
jgi:8-oxo-dGTP diphosphatase